MPPFVPIATVESLRISRLQFSAGDARRLSPLEGKVPDWRGKEGPSYVDSINRVDRIVDRRYPGLAL